MTKSRTLLWQPDLRTRSGPRFLAIVGALTDDIRAGRLHAGDRLPTHRALAKALQLSLGTVTRAYQEAEQSGLLTSRVGCGTFVAAGGPANPLGLPSERLIEMSVDLPLHRHDPDLGLALQRMARRDDLQQMLRYQDHLGSARHRRAGAAWAERFGLAVGADDVAVCAGSHHALSMAITAVSKPGDVVLCDALTYPGLRAIAGQLHRRIHAVQARADGSFDLDAVAAACRRRPVRAFYCSPSLHNPTTAQMDGEQRAGLAELAAARGFHILEDDVHRLVSDATAPPIAAIAPEHTFFVASFSKAVAAGLRVAFLVPPRALRSRVADASYASVWAVPPLPVEVAASWIEDGTADAVVRAKRREAAARQRVFAQVLAGQSFAAQSCGYYAWLHLPRPWTSTGFVDAARSLGVAVTPSSVFAVGAAAPPAAVRVCLGGPETRAEATRGVELLARLLEGGPSRAAT